MSLKVAGKLNEICCDACKLKSVRAALSGSRLQLLIYDIITSNGEMPVHVIADKAGNDPISIASTLARMKGVGLVKACKRDHDYRETFYSINS